MNLRRVKHSLLRLSIEEKVVALGTLVVFVGSFMPWYSVVVSFKEEQTTSNAFTGDIGVIGFVIFIMTLISLLHLLSESLHIRLPHFGYKREQILFFLMGESFFLTLLTLAIYTQRSLDFIDASLRFGIYVTLVGTFLSAFAAFARVQKTKEKQVKEFFHQTEEDAQQEFQEADAQGVQPMYFGEDKSGPVISPAFQASKPNIPHMTELNQNQYLPEDEMVEGVGMIQNNQSQDPSPHHTPNQADFFSRQAGIK